MKRRTDPTEGLARCSVAACSAEHSGFGLWCRAMRWQRAVDRALADTGLTHTQYWVLVSAARAQQEQGDAVSQQQIADAASLDRATISDLVRKLQAKGLVDRGPSMSGVRWRVIVTDRGRRLLLQCAPRIQRLAQDLAV